MRKVPFVNGGFYHVYNRGVDKRQVFNNNYDINRFLQGLNEFNCINPIGSIYENSFIEETKKRKKNNLVNIICFCLNHNHYHLLLQQLVDGGISEFMRRIGTGYTQHFNFQNKRSGALFQGKFKSTHVGTNEYLLYLSAYINLNHKIHSLSNRIAKSSWEEYIDKSNESFCKKDVVLDQFDSATKYKIFTLNCLQTIKENKDRDSEFNKLLLE